MGCGRKDEENPASEDEVEAERRELNPNAEEGVELKKIPVKVNDKGFPEIIQGHSNPLIKSHHLKYMLLGFNGFITVLGLVLLSLSIWVRVDPEFWEYETTLDVDNFHAVCTMLIVSSVVVVVVGFIGCLGAASERRWMLLIFMGVFGIIFLLELAAVILMWSAPYSKTITKELEKQIKQQIDDRNTDDSARQFMDFIQENLECCGSTGSRDYASEVPNSCQDSVSGNIYTAGCASKMLSYLRTKAGIIGGVALPILLLQCLALLSAGCLIKSIEVESRYFM